MEVVFVENGLTKKKIAQETDKLLREGKKISYIAKQLNRSKYEILENYILYNQNSKFNKPSKKNISKLYREGFSIEYITKIYKVSEQYVKSITDDININKHQHNTKTKRQNNTKSKDVLLLYDEEKQKKIATKVKQMRDEKKNFYVIEKVLKIDKYSLLVMYEKYYPTFKNRNDDSSIITLHKNGFRYEEISEILNLEKICVAKVINKSIKNKKSEKKKKKKNTYKVDIHLKKKEPKDLKQYTNQRWVKSVVYNPVGTKR